MSNTTVELCHDWGNFCSRFIHDLICKHMISPDHHRTSRIPRWKNHGVSSGFIEISHRSKNFKHGSVTCSRYQDAVLDPAVRLYAAAFGTIFILLDDNARTLTAMILNDYLDSEGIERLTYSPDFNPIENVSDEFSRAGCK